MQKEEKGLPEVIENAGLDGALAQARYYRIIADTMGLIHAQIPTGEYNTARVATETDIREENFQGQVYKRAVMYLMSNGCEWALLNGNGCTMCGHLAKQRRLKDNITVQDFLTQFHTEYARIDFQKYQLLNVYNNGSFLNENEIPAEARREILRIIGQNQDIKMLVLETRPEYVTAEKIREIKELVPHIHVEIAMGLELMDDFYRYICINKGFSLDQYDTAARIITEYLDLRTYVMLKPPLLTEQEGIDEVVKTIKHAYGMGSRTVSLETCTIQDYTLVNYLAERERFQTAWLWSIIEVIRQTAHLGHLIVGMFQFYPSPIKVPYNCDQCSDIVMEALKEYNRTLNPAVCTQLTCECIDEWRKELAKPAEPFAARMEYLHQQLAGETSLNRR